MLSSHTSLHHLPTHPHHHNIVVKARIYTTLQYFLFKGITQRLSTSPLLLEIIHIRCSNRASHNLQSSNCSNICPGIIFNEKGETFDALEFDVVKIYCIRDVLQIGGSECDGLCWVNILYILQSGVGINDVDDNGIVSLDG